MPGISLGVICQLVALQAAAFATAWWWSPDRANGVLKYWLKGTVWLCLGVVGVLVVFWEDPVVRRSISLTLLTILAASMLRYRNVRAQRTLSH